MRPIDADALAAEGWILYRSITTERSGTVEYAGLWKAPTVEAVPLDQLCTCLTGFKAPPPKYALEAIGAYDPIDPKSVVYTPEQIAKAWEYAIKTMMECKLISQEGESDVE